MFGFLKKKLKESVNKIKNVAKKKEEVIEKIEKEIKEDKIPEEIEKIEPKLKEEIKEVKKKPEKKKGLIRKIKKAITEKELKDEDLNEVMKDLEISLIQSDVAVEVAEKIIKDLKKELIGKSVKRREIEKIINNSFKKSITEILNVDGYDFLKKVKSKKPFLIVFLGFNGSGKTTTIARIGKLLNKNNLKCVFAAADTWRAASIEQLEEHGRKLGIEVIKQKYLADPAAVVFDAVKHAEAKDIDVILADTAGRSHTNINLMDELKKIIRVNKPDLKILVLDALTGNDIYDQCKMFNDAVGVDGLIITKVDVYEKGGAAISAAYTIKKPLLYLGVGQGYDDLEKFNADKVVKNLL
ncbi:MAG: signal recognition particle-docking protein FtsY [Candidatus Aenigmatarchaeota archaeon]